MGFGFTTNRHGPYRSWIQTRRYDRQAREKKTAGVNRRAAVRAHTSHRPDDAIKARQRAWNI